MRPWDNLRRACLGLHVNVAFARQSRLKPLPAASVPRLNGARQNANGLTCMNTRLAA